MKRYLILYVLLVISARGFSQRDTREQIDAGIIEKISVFTNEVYKIHLKAARTKQVSIRTHSEGEYYDDIYLETSQRGNELLVTTRYPEKLAGGFDKLSAHKVFSLEIEVEVPEDMIVAIKSNIASVEGSGHFKSVFVELKQGYCYFTDFLGAAVINTYQGNITVETPIANIEATSRHGEVDLPEFEPGRNALKLTSIDGDIMVRKN